KDHKKLFDHFPQTFADSNGTLYVAWNEVDGDSTALAYVYSHDAGKTWSDKVVALNHKGKSLFLWGAAGSAGRVGFSWYEAPDPAGKYYTQAAILTSADTPTPQVFEARVSDTPALPYPPCESGTACTSGRELGDFQMCAVAPDGSLVVSYVVVKDAPSGGHIAFARLAQGPS